MDVLDGERKRGADLVIVFMGFDLDLFGDKRLLGFNGRLNLEMDAFQF
jgi:hypothetical protein